MSKLPNGWELVTISDFFDVRDGTHDSPKYLQNGGFPLITSKNIKSGEIDLKNVNYISRNDYEEINKRSQVDIGDLLFSMIGTIGSMALVNDQPSYAIKNVALFKPLGVVKSRFLQFYLKSPQVIKKMEDEAKGTTQKFVGLGYLRGFPFLLPPLNEQKRIVEKLDKLFAHLETLKARLERVPELLKQFRQSVLTQAVTGKLTEDWREENHVHLNESMLQAIGEGEFRSTNGIGIPDNWAWASFDSVAQVKSNLVQPKDYKKYFLIAPDNIESKTGKLLSKPLVSDINPKSSKHFFEEGSIVYSKIRPYLSKVIIADFDGLCSADMYPIGVKNALKIDYLYFYMLSDIFLEFANSAGSRSVLPKINQKELGIIPIPVPPLEEQKEIVRRVEALFEKADLIERQYEMLKEKIEHLPQAILAKAFCGELVPQDSNDEPVDVLLERIQAEKEGRPVKKKSNMLYQLKLSFSEYEMDKYTEK